MAQLTADKTYKHAIHQASTLHNCCKQLNSDEEHVFEKAA
jgi:hypothetical protein